MLGPALVEARFARGCRCFAVYIDGAVGGYGWLSTGPEWIGEIQCLITPRPGEGYVWNCFTMPEHRRKGIFKSLLVGVSNTARAGGLRRLWIGSVAIPAEKSVGPAGFMPALSFSSAAIAGMHLLRVNARDTALARDALEVLAVRPGLHVRRSTSRRH